MVKSGGFKLPSHIANAPEVDDFLILPWRAFWDLRRGTVPTTPLRWIDVQQWCNAYAIETDQALGLHACIVELDTLYIAYHIERAEEDRKRREAEAKANASVSRGKR